MNFDRDGQLSIAIKEKHLDFKRMKYLTIFSLCRIQSEIRNCSFSWKIQFQASYGCSTQTIKHFFRVTLYDYTRRL